METIHPLYRPYGRPNLVGPEVLCTPIQGLAGLYTSFTPKRECFQGYVQRPWITCKKYPMRLYGMVFKRIAYQRHLAAWRSTSVGWTGL